ncbi:MAG: polysaccharide biosynthesis protein, partial [Alphaproteobacteria bacterium]|nr:polysaccharide biosynthesis protein [Alphaproteobacteria bacterium]
MRLNLSFLKSLLAVSHDLIVTALALVLAYLVRYLDQPQPLPIMAMVQHGAILLATATVVYPLSGLYRGVWAYASVNDLAAIIRSTFITLLCFTAISFLATRMEFLP